MNRTTNFRARVWRGRSPGALTLALALLAALLLAACGSSSSSGGGSSGKSLTLGSKNFPEELLLGQLYKQALAAKGYTVNYKESIGATEIVDRALTSGQIDAYPEYTGVSVATVAGINRTLVSARQAYTLANNFYLKRGQVMSQITPFYDTDAIAVLRTFATKHGLKTMADLRKLPHFTLGAAPEFLNRQQGAAGMHKLYGINNFTFRSLATGVTYQALDGGSVDAIDAFTTDPQLASGKYTLLSDPRHLFGFQNVALVINRRKLAQLGGQKFLSIIDKVNALLTSSAITAMNKAVQLDKQPAASVARAFLKANGLV